MSKKGHRSDYGVERDSESTRPLPRQLADGLDDVDDLMRAKEWTTARGLDANFD